MYSLNLTSNQDPATQQHPHTVQQHPQQPQYRHATQQRPQEEAQAAAAQEETLPDVFQLTEEQSVDVRDPKQRFQTVQQLEFGTDRRMGYIKEVQEMDEKVQDLVGETSQVKEHWDILKQFFLPQQAKVYLMQLLFQTGSQLPDIKSVLLITTSTITTTAFDLSCLFSDVCFSFVFAAGFIPCL